MIEKRKILTLLTFTCAFSGHLHAESSAMTPEVILPDGVDATISINPYTGESGLVRKGTAAATIQNIALLNQHMAKPNDPVTDQEIEKVSSEIGRLIPSLTYIGVFDFFEPIEWIGSSEQPGRVLAAALYLKQHPGEMTEEIERKIQDISTSTPSDYLRNLLQTTLVFCSSI